ncbi:hypothetical protein DRW07_11210 [Alteromonas sediminis]|uniref:DUF4488 domain-containing protein n=1 Tax=Alteromonas sediminis TaxID=2259342 RepID=A0A3N5Y134_9ALTE|nr:hypothetical protein [Alteromonas sediminis]RPJ66643.1 hypothetical protein DRW07_11210 [Alteromonas sediminis]
MRRIVLFLPVIFLLVSASLHAHPFVGTWELVSGEYIDQDGKRVQYSDLNFKSLKVITEQHFSFVTMAGEAFWSAGAGQYWFTDDQYIELPSYNSFSSPKGKKYVFTYKINGDEWHNERWENGVRVEFEVWRRNKPEEHESAK